MEFLKLSKTCLVNFDYVSEVRIDFPSKGKVAIFIHGQTNYHILDLHEWEEFAIRVGFYDFTEDYEKYMASKKGETKCK